MAPWLWSASASAAPPRSKTRLTSGPSRASTAAENSSVKLITSPGLSRRAGLANACQHPSDRCRCNVSSTRASPLTPTRRAGITRVSLKTIRSPGRSRAGRSATVRWARPAERSRRRAESRGRAGRVAIASRGRSKSKASTRTDGRRRRLPQGCAVPNRSARRRAIIGETKLETSPPREAISLTSLEAMK